MHKMPIYIRVCGLCSEFTIVQLLTKPKLSQLSISDTKLVKARATNQIGVQNMHPQADHAKSHRSNLFSPLDFLTRNNKLEELKGVLVKPYAETDTYMDWAAKNEPRLFR